jgi:hypothetical protein
VREAGWMASVKWVAHAGWAPSVRAFRGGPLDDPALPARYCSGCKLKPRPPCAAAPGPFCAVRNALPMSMPMPVRVAVAMRCCLRACVPPCLPAWLCPSGSCGRGRGLARQAHPARRPPPGVIARNHREKRALAASRRPPSTPQAGIPALERLRRGPVAGRYAQPTAATRPPGHASGCCWPLSARRRAPASTTSNNTTEQCLAASPRPSLAPRCCVGAHELATIKANAVSHRTLDARRPANRPRPPLSLPPDKASRSCPPAINTNTSPSGL